MLTKNEIIGIGVILLVVSVFAYFNLANSILLARDVQRKNDLKHIATALTQYTNKAGVYPKSSEGKLAACGENLDSMCRWGIDPLVATDSAVIMERLPNDPSWADSTFYLYRSNTRDFQMYAHLEDKEDSEYKEEIAKQGFLCGNKICNFGLSSSKLPLTENIESVTVEQ